MNRLALVVAVSRNGVIGRDGGLPWHFPEDLRHFKAVTTGHAIIMGRKTWDSIGRPLPRRRNIVVSRQEGLKIDGVEVVSSLEAGVELARVDDTEPRIIGGASLYSLALPQATTVYLTEIDQEVRGDTYFPRLNREVWEEVERRPGEDPRLLFLTLQRVGVAR